jgi:hypothetical protein
MTPQTLYRFDLSEIPSIDLTCKQCKSVFKITLPRPNLSPTMACMGCGLAFWYEGNSIYPLVQAMIRNLGSYVDRESDQTFTIGFSLVSPSPASSR